MNSSQNGGVGEVNRRYADVVELHTAIVERSLAYRMADSPRSRVAFGAWSLFAKAREICRKVLPFSSGRFWSGAELPETSVRDPSVSSANRPYLKRAAKKPRIFPKKP